MNRFCLLLALIPGTMFAQANPDPLTLVPESVRAKLMSQGEVHEYADKPNNIAILRGAPQGDVLTKGFTVKDGNLAAALYAWIPLPKGADEVAIIKALTSVSSMKGLQVYSESLKRMEVFIFDAYRVDSIDKPAALSDPIPNQNMKFVFFQNEEQTGKGFVEESLTPLGNGLVVRLVNKTGLNYGFVPLVAAGDLQTAIVVIPGKDHVLLVGVTVAKTWSLFGLERGRAGSLYNRMHALVTWFANNLGAS